MADIKNQAIKFHYGTIDAYNEKKAAGQITAQDIYFVTDDDSESLKRGFLYLNGEQFGAGVLDVSVSEVVDSSFNITVKEFDASSGKIISSTHNIPVSEVSLADFNALKQRVDTLESDVSTLKDDVSTLKDDVSTLDASVDALQDKMDLLFGDPEYPADSSGILSTLAQDIEDVDASVTQIFNEVYPTIERLETSVFKLETSVHTIEQRVDTLETVVERSVGDISTLADFKYDYDSSTKDVSAFNVVALSKDSSNNASLGVYVDGKYVKVKDVTDKAGLAHQVITVDVDAIGAASGEVPLYTIQKISNPDAQYSAQYRLTTQDGITKGDVINIPKDLLVRSAELKVVETEDDPYVGAHVGDKYIDFVIYTAEPSAATNEHIYLPVNDLVDVYTIAVDSSKYLSINGQNEISFNADEVVSYVDASLGVDASISRIDSSLDKHDASIKGLDASVKSLDASVQYIYNNVDLTWGDI